MGGICNRDSVSSAALFGAAASCFLRQFASEEDRTPIGNLIESRHIADRAVKIGRVGVNFRSGHGGYSGIDGIAF